MSNFDIQSDLLTFEVPRFMKFDFGFYVSRCLALSRMIRLSSTNWFRNPNDSNVNDIQDGDIFQSHSSILESS
jgi:hypothetical protein